MVSQFNQSDFIELDPISIPKRFELKQDIEISGLWIALLAWGNRKTIIQSGTKLMDWMDQKPYEFILHHTESERKPFLKFVHRTFNGEDALYFLEFFQNYYKEHTSLESAFTNDARQNEEHVGPALIRFRANFIKYCNPAKRCLKHIASPEANSKCKRLLMFLRWMVRSDPQGIDFGIWKTIKPSQLLMPLDVHVEKNARKLGMLNRKQSDWKAVLELSATCRTLDPMDPVKYDFALFGLGISEKKTSSTK